MGQFDRAIGCNEEALAIAREIGNRWGEIWLGRLGRAYNDLGQVERAVKLYEEALAIAREIGDRRVQCHCLSGLSRALLATRQLSGAQRCCEEALDLDMPETSYSVALVLGIVLLYQGNPASGDAFTDAAGCCQAMLEKTVGLYQARYALAAALVGQAVCDPRWAEEDERASLLAPALEEYQRALENCAAPGVVHDALHDLEMIRAAGVEGLEPVFELVESAV